MTFVAITALRRNFVGMYNKVGCLCLLSTPQSSQDAIKLIPSHPVQVGVQHTFGPWAIFLRRFHGDSITTPLLRALRPLRSGSELRPPAMP